MWLTLLGLLLPALLGLGTNVLANKINNASLSGAQSEQNAYNSFEAQQQRDWSSNESQLSRDFNAEQAQINRDFNAEQAQLDRDFQAEQAQNQMDFQERMDNSVYQRRVADMKAAGINPALAVGGISVGSTAGASGSGAMASGSAASSSPASGAAASGHNPAYPVSMSDMIQSMMMSKNMSLLDSQIQQNDAKTMRDLAEAGLLGEQRIGQQLSNSWFEPMKKAELDNLLDQLKNNRVQRALNRQNISESEAREALTLTQNIIAKADAATRDQLNRASIRMTLSQAGLNSALASESNKRLGLIDAEINELYQRSIMESMQAGKFSAEEIESMERAGVLRVEREVSESTAEKRIESANVVVPKLDYVLGVAQKTASIVGQVAGGVAIGSGIARGLSGYRNYRGYAPSVARSYGKSYNMYASQGSSLFTNYTQNISGYSGVW